MTSFVVAWLPVAVVAGLAVFARRPALELALAGVATTAVLALTYFTTAPRAVLLAAVDGTLTNLPILLVVFLGIFLSVFLLETGSLSRLVQWVLGDGGPRWHRQLVLSVGGGNMMEGAGVVAEPVVAPMIRASGVDPETSSILSVQGYSGVMALSMAGAVLTILHTATGLPLEPLARDAAWLSLPAMAVLIGAIPLTAGRGSSGDGREGGGLHLVVLTAVLVGATLLAVTYYIGFSVTAFFCGLVVTAVLLALQRHMPPVQPGILRDLAPFLLIAGCLSAVNMVPSIRDFTFEQAAVSVRVVPVHEIVFRPLFSAYLYLAAALGLAFVLFPLGRERFRSVVASSTGKGLRAVAAMSLFGMMGQMVAFSGYDGAFTQLEADKNMALVLATGLVDGAGSLYPVCAPFLGWVGTFLTGYGSAGIMLFAGMQVPAAESLGVSPTWLASAVAVGASVGSVSSPFKLALAAPLVGAEGKEGAMLRKTIPLGLAASLAVGLVVLLAA